MKIAFILENLEIERGGAESYAHRLAHFMRNKGHEITLIGLGESVPIDGINIESIRRLPHPLLRRMYFTKKAKEKAQKGTFDIVFSFTRTLFHDVYRLGGGCQPIYLRQYALSLGKGRISRLRYFQKKIRPDVIFLLYVERLNFKRKLAKLNIAVSNWVKNQIEESYGMYAGNKVEVIYNGVDTNFFMPPSISKDKLKNRLGLPKGFGLLFVSNNYRLKGLYPLIKALSMMDEKLKKDCSLWIIGKDRYKPYLNFSKNFSSPIKTIFLGRKSPKEIRVYYQAADILLHPTYFDPCANVCLEALSSGLPVLTTPFNGSGEIIRQEVEGEVVGEPWKIQLWKKRVEYYLNKELLSSLSLNARKRAEKMDFRDHCENLLEIIKKLSL